MPLPAHARHLSRPPISRLAAISVRRATATASRRLCLSRQCRQKINSGLTLRRKAYIVHLTYRLASSREG